jgi:hypothetical protein
MRQKEGETETDNETVIHAWASGVAHDLGGKDLTYRRLRTSGKTVGTHFIRGQCLQTGKDHVQQVNTAL